MSYSIAIASGKGGTGKTTVAVSLYTILSKNLKGSVRLVDCDVEEPNDRLFFPKAPLQQSDEVFKQVPFISTDKCTYCRKCVEYCEFNAIVVLPSAEFAEVNPDLCHSCGACLVACEFDAISEKPEAIGHIQAYTPIIGSGLSEGRLKIGSSMQTMLIRELKKKSSSEEKLIIYDAPPGSSCPVVETIADTDFVLLVAEPTPFGVHDLGIMVKLLKEIKKPFGVIINKAGLGDNQIYSFLKEEEVRILAEIPFSTDYAKHYAEGKLTDHIPAQIKAQLERIAHFVEEGMKS